MGFFQGSLACHSLQIDVISTCVYVLFCTSESPSADFDQLELPVLCDGLRRYLQDLPQPIIPTALYAQMVHAAKGEIISSVITGTVYVKHNH